MLALSPKARNQARIAGLVCAAYGTAMFATHAYVKARQSHPVVPVVFQHPTTLVPKKRSPKQTTAKVSRPWGAETESRPLTSATSERTQVETSNPPPTPPGGGTVSNSSQITPVSTPAAPVTMIAPAPLVSGGGMAPHSQGFIPSGAPGMAQQFRPDYRGPVFPGQRPPNYPNLHSSRPPPPMPRGAPRAAWGNHPTAPPPRHK
jgi:hypothetical protein